MNLYEKDKIMEFFEVVEKRRTIRDFETEKMPKEVIEKIIDAGLKAPTNDQQNAYKDAVPKQHKMLLDASVIVIPLLKQKTDILKPDNVSHLNGFASIWCSIENIFLASTAEGFACTLRVPLGNEADYAQKVLGFPKDYFMPCFIGIGRPKADATIIKQKEIDVKDRIHWDRW